MKETIEFTLNNESVRLDIEPDRSLLWVLRGHFELTGTKYACGMGLCGACMTLVDGSAMPACRLDMEFIANKTVTTIEGLASGDDLHPVQQAFVEHDALQCGYCTPGMIISAVGLLANNPTASDTDICQGLEGNLCRCGAHKRIVDAVRSVTRKS